MNWKKFPIEYLDPEAIQLGWMIVLISHVLIRNHWPYYLQFLVPVITGCTIILPMLLTRALIDRRAGNVIYYLGMNELTVVLFGGTVWCIRMTIIWLITLL